MTTTTSIRPAAHLLVVDDSQTVRKLVEISLRSTRHTADFVASGAEAIVYAKRTQPDLILLDFVLPDMRGPDVCAAFARDRVNTNICVVGGMERREEVPPVVLMTAKGENVRELFSAYPFVIDYVGKPFTPAGIIDVIDRALANAKAKAAPNLSTRNANASASRPSTHPNAARRRGFGGLGHSTLTFTQKELAASKLYSRLKSAFASIPRYMSDLGPHENAATFFARKILSPETIEDLLESLLPFYRRILVEEEAKEARDKTTTASSNNVGFQGHVESWPLADILMLFSASGRSGELTLTLEERTLIAYFNEGELRLVTCRDPHDYMRGCLIDLRSVSASTLDAARAEQRASGKPLHISIAEAGELPTSCDLATTLHGRSKRLLMDALEARSGRFRWRDVTTFPSYVEAYGRHISVSREHQQRDTLMFGPPDSNPPPVSSLSQIALESLRVQQQTIDSRKWSVPRPVPESIFARTQGFSQRLLHFTITAQERKVLAVVDGKRTFAETVEKSALPIDEVALILNRLAAVGLLYPRTDEQNVSDRRSSPPLAAAILPASRPVAILEPDIEGFQRPLESLLMNRVDPIGLVNLANELDLVAAIVRECPRLVILNIEAAAGGSGIDIGGTAKAIRAANAHLEDVPLVAVLEAAARERADEISLLGFNAVLVKPVLYSDLERLLSVSRPN